MSAIGLAFIGAFAFALLHTDTSTKRAPEPEPASPPAIATPHQPVTPSPSPVFACLELEIIDGDTLRCDGRSIRLASIDAPEMPGHCRRGRTCVDGDPFASKANLEQLTQTGTVECRQIDTDRYNRIVARCSANGRDLSCAQVAMGFAIVRYRELVCPTD